MAIADVTAEYVNYISDSKYASRTSNTTEFDSLKQIMSDAYLTTQTTGLPANKYNMGLALLVLHHYGLDDTTTPDKGGTDRTVGSVQSESVGDVSKSWGGGMPSMGNVPGWKAWLLQTQWGTQFLYLMRTFRSGPFVT